MAKTFCEKHVCICGLFTILLICACGYLFYAGWWLPIAINTHRLRHNQLIPFEIYKMSLSDWYKYSMSEEHISVLTYRQMQEMKYQFILGWFEPANFSISDLDADQSQNLSRKIDGLYEVSSWQQFSGYVDEYVDGERDSLYIAMYSTNICVDEANQTEIYDCFDNWWEHNNGTVAPEYFIYTPLSNQVFVDVNSIHASDVLDGPRDVFMFIIMMFCFIWFFLVIDFFEDPTIGWEGINYLIITMFFVGAYYLWVFVLSVVPVFFSLPVFKTNLDYYRESLYSLTYVVGNYDPYWWVAGVLLSGIWAYSLILFIPVIGVLYLLIATICCCDEEKTDKCGACVIIPVLLISICIIIIFTIGYYVLFIGNMAYWNVNTYKDMTDDNVIQAVTAILVFFILLPIMGCCLAATTKWNKKYEKQKKRKVIHRAGTSLQRLPIVKNRISSTKPTKEAGTETETVAMTRNAGGTQQDIAQA